MHAHKHAHSHIYLNTHTNIATISQIYTYEQIHSVSHIYTLLHTHTHTPCLLPVLYIVFIHLLLLMFTFSYLLHTSLNSSCLHCLCTSFLFSVWRKVLIFLSFLFVSVQHLFLSFFFFLHVCSVFNFFFPFSLCIKSFSTPHLLFFVHNDFM